jgi:hypothetical protein
MSGQPTAPSRLTKAEQDLVEKARRIVNQRNAVPATAPAPAMKVTTAPVVKRDRSMSNVAHQLALIRTTGGNIMLLLVVLVAMIGGYIGLTEYRLYRVQKNFNDFGQNMSRELERAGREFERELRRME